MDFKTLSADLESQPITGYLHTGARFHVPLISEIDEGLYVGGCIDGVDVGDFFSHIFSLYMWEQYVFDQSATIHREVKMYDSRTDPIDVDSVEGFSDEIVRALEKGGNVLVHCQAGINRSNLVATRVLMKRYGSTAKEAIAVLRDKRSSLVLSNNVFENYLLSLDS